MDNVPGIVVDNFYSDPDGVRNWALQHEFAREEEGAWPGKRTRELEVIDPIFHQQFINKIFSLFMPVHEDITAKVQSMFQIIPTFESDPKSPKNKGWIHEDDGVLFAGVVFLTPNIDRKCGTSLFTLEDENKLDWSDAKNNFYVNGIDNDYDNAITTHNSAFDESVRFQNLYNRCIIFDHKCYHGVNSFYNSQDQDRLTQVFFVHSVDMDVPPPMARHRNFL